MSADEAQDEVSESKDTEITKVDTTKPADTVEEVEEDVDFDAAENEGVVEEKTKENPETPSGKEENSEKKSKRTVEFTQTGSLSIKGFKRPLQEAKVKEKMESFGPVKHFWMNNTKSACLVTWMSVEDSRRARKKLHGSFFPPDLKPPLAGKLKCEKTDEKNVIFHQNNKKRKPRKNRLFAKALKESTDSIKASRKRKRKGDSSSKEMKKKTKRNLDLATELLLNYCKRTDAKPRIFWKPLTSEEIKEKEKQKRIEEQRERRKREDHQALLRSRNRRSRSPRRRDRDRDRRRSPRRERSRRDRDRRRSPRRDYRSRRGDRRY